MKVKFIFLWVFAVFMFACGTNKEAIYLQGIQDTAIIDSVFTNPLTIHPGDQLSISLSSLNSEADAIINQSNSGGGAANSVGASSGANVAGYKLKENGSINMPRLGSIYIEGKTHEQLKDTLQKLLEPYTKNPIVNVRLLNYQITVLGEVTNPGQLKITTPQTDILQVIGLAGDITPYGRRDNILLIRKMGTNRIVKRLNLTDPNLFRNPYFQLQPGDFIYIEPNKAKKNQTSLTYQLWPMITGSLSLLVVIFATLTR